MKSKEYPAELKSTIDLVENQFKKVCLGMMRTKEWRMHIDYIEINELISQ